MRPTGLFIHCSLNSIFHATVKSATPRTAHVHGLPDITTYVGVSAIEVLSTFVPPYEFLTFWNGPAPCSISSIKDLERPLGASSNSLLQLHRSRPCVLRHLSTNATAMPMAITRLMVVAVMSGMDGPLAAGAAPCCEGGAAETAVVVGSMEGAAVVDDGAWVVGSSEGTAVVDDGAWVVGSSVGATVVVGMAVVVGSPEGIWVVGALVTGAGVGGNVSGALMPIPSTTAFIAPNTAFPAPTATPAII